MVTVTRRAQPPAAPAERHALTGDPTPVRAAGRGAAEDPTVVPAWGPALELFAEAQRRWWGHWSTLAAASMAFWLPMSAARLAERFQEGERRAAERQAELRAALSQMAADLRADGRALDAARAQGLRDAIQPLVANQTALEERVEQLGVSLHDLIQTQAQRAEAANATLVEDQRHRHERLSDEIGLAIRSLDVPTPAEVARLRELLTALADDVTAMRAELAELGRARPGQRPEAPAVEEPDPVVAPPAEGATATPKGRADKRSDTPT